MATTIDIGSSNEPVIVMTRLFDAPRPLVWKAITDPKHVAQWYGGEGFTSPICEMDVRPGGAWRHVMQAPNGAQFTINCIFIDVVEPERLVWRTVADENRKPSPPVAVNTVTLEECGLQTKWMLVARFESFEQRDITAKMGFGPMISQGLERMAAHLKTL
jgi:uncharacterized protein YndB with AHSA1/START domain